MAGKKNGAATGDGTDMGDLEALLGEPSSPDNDSALVPGIPASPEDAVKRMQAYAKGFERINTFKVGQLVQWKTGLMNKIHPAYGDPIIVVTALDKPVYSDNPKGGAGSSYFMEPLTLIAGRIDKDGDFVCVHYDGRRMEPYQQEL